VESAVAQRHFINGERITRRKLEDGDKIQLSAAHRPQVQLTS
jgi:hypothetical protein